MNLKSFFAADSSHKLKRTYSFGISEAMRTEFEQLKSAGFEVNPWLRTLVEQHLPKVKEAVKNRAPKASK